MIGSPTRLAVTLALTAVAALGLGACTDREPATTAVASASPAPATPTPTPTPAPVRLGVRTSGPQVPLTAVTGSGETEQSLSTSRELFDAAPVAVVAPSGQPDTQLVAAHAAVTLGVPLLVGPAPDPAAPADAPAAAPDAALAAELERLAVTAVLEVGDVAGIDATDDRDGPGPVVVHAEPVPAAVAQATGLTLGEPVLGDPATYAGQVAALAPAPPAGPSTGPSAGPSSGTTPPDGAALPPFDRAVPLADAVALAVDAPDGLASVATARAAGVPVHLAPAAAPNPQSTPSVVEALHASAAPHVLALGPALAAEPALDWKVRSARTGYQLPGGGQVVFPRHQLVALYGTPVTAALGVLGEQGVEASVQRARETAAQYAGLSDRTPVPTFEIIATVAAGGAGADGNFSNEQPIDVLRPWVEAAGAAGVPVVLDLQPGRSDFLTQAQQYEELLRLPHVGLALDPEWRLGPDELPLQRIGSVGAAEVNAVSTWLADLTNTHGLPPKVFVLHQFQLRMIADRAAVDTSRPELAVVLHVDGQGTQPAKQGTWRTLQQDAPAGVAWGWKNFVDEDLPMLTPQQTVADVVPLPDLVTYQ